MKSLLTEEQRITTRTYRHIAVDMINRMFEIGNAANDRSEALEQSKHIMQYIADTPELSVPVNREMVDFAIEVIYQWGYEVEDGVYTSGGLSTLESAFAILRSYNLLDDKGRYRAKG